MKFTHEPLSDVAAEAEERALRRSPDCRVLRMGGFRQKAIAKTTMYIVGMAAIAAWFSDAPGMAVGAAVLAALACGIWAVVAALHDESTQVRREDIAKSFAVPPDHELKYLLAMREEYHEIDAAIRDWNARGLTIRTRDAWAVRAWVNKVEPVRKRDRLLRQLAS
ncbi:MULTISPECIES: hypothetical protein [unclassified Rhodanobacter]|uniref:hypothetical protein n=1 Tax=unclassified Rhodanobacter TaxID=2621553 RepID=UPI0007AA146C|nr:hypothetical protein [Rhodanobacter sp. FW510-R10]KZC32609.1 hypothetical protein RhoFW510R10_11890 [Rhodanobacter sp. FW510-R10]